MTDLEMDNYIKTTLERVRLVRPLIIEHVKKSGAMKRSVSGQIDCPVCKTGKVNYSRAGSYNGHVSAECTTADCVRWIE